jgi:hypothetical protein
LFVLTPRFHKDLVLNYCEIDQNTKLAQTGFYFFKHPLFRQVPFISHQKNFAASLVARVTKQNYTKKTIGKRQSIDENNS